MFAAQGEAKDVNLASVSAAVANLKTGEPLFNKNAQLVMPIASITKVMTAMVVLDAKLPLDEKIKFTKADKQRINSYFSRIRLDSEISRAEVLRLALMSSENLAAAALAANYPGGYNAFVKAMNKKAKSLGMKNTRFVDSAGLSVENVSTARDLSLMVAAAAKYPKIKEYSTSAVHTAYFKKPKYKLGYTNTNGLVRAGKWEISLSKTGYLDEAGRCLVMITELKGEPVVMVMLDSFGKRSPLGDANRLKKWITTGNVSKVASAASNYEQTKLASYLASNK